MKTAVIVADISRRYQGRRTGPDTAIPHADGALSQGGCLERRLHI